MRVRSLRAALGAALLVSAFSPLPTAAAQSSGGGCPISFAFDQASASRGQAGTGIVLQVSMSPSCAPLGGPSNPVSSYDINFNGVPASASGFLSQGSGGILYLSVPPAASTGPLTITVGWSSGPPSVYSVPFTVPPPAATSVAQKSGTGIACTVFAAGQPVTITGTNFGSVEGGPDAVLVDGAPDPEVTAWLAFGHAQSLASPASATEQIAVTLPASLTSGQHTVAVHTGGGTSNALTITTGAATSTGCGSMSLPTGGGGSPTGGGASGGSSTHTAPAVTTTPPATTPNKSPTQPASLGISGPASLARSGQAAYSLTPVQTGTVTWATSDPRVATVSPTGLLTAHSPGVVTLSAVSHGRGATKVITVAAAKQSKASIAHRTRSAARQGAPAPLLVLLVILILLLFSLLLWLRRRRKPTQPNA